VFVLIGLALLAMTVRGMYILRMALLSRQWTVTEGLVLDAHMQERRDDKDGDTFYPVVRYSYQAGRKKYESSRLWYRTDSFGNYAEALRGIRDVRVGRRVDVYYDPAAPSRSVLIPGYEPANVASVALCAIALAVFLAWRISFF
jgi:hypothetical protein